MKIVTSKEMREIDQKTIQVHGICSLVLMERAGLAVVEKIIELHCPGKVIVLSGSGNNGGDGLVIARELHNRGLRVKVLMVGNRNKLSPDCKQQLETAKKIGVPVEFKTMPGTQDLHGALVVDAIFGTGLSKNISGRIAETIETVNGSKCPVVAVDIASGISSDTGQVLGIAVRANTTVTFGAPKRGHLLYPGADYAGRLFVEDIGFSPGLFSHISCNLLEREDMALLVPDRPSYSHKGDYGHVLIVAGSRGKTGAARMAARACLRTGAGLVTIGAPEHLTGSFQSSVMEEMFLPLPDSGRGTLPFDALEPILEFMDEKADILAIGPGIGSDEGTVTLVEELLKRCTSPVVVDADAINALSGKKNVLNKAKAPLILTPHPGEFSRLSGHKISEIEQDRIGSAILFAKEAGVYLVLKGTPTVIAEPDGNSFVNSTGNPGLAKGGTGDILTGITASLLSQGLSPLEASLMAVYLHGLAADLASCEKTMHSLLASDVIEAIPSAFESLKDSSRI